MKRWSRMLTCGLGLLAAWSATGSARAAIGPQSLASAIEQVQPKIVKVYGAGGVRSLEPYQSGFLISPDGHIATAWSYVLDTDYLSVVLHGGERFSATLVGADPKLEIAVLKIDAPGQDAFDLAARHPAIVGSRVLAFSNLFNVAAGNEASSVQRGVISTRTRLEARRGSFETPYRGDVYVVDAITNNPGAAGGALTDRRGRLIGMLGKELRNAQSGAWLNYAIPVEEFAEAVAEIIAGKPRAASAEKAPKNSRSLDLTRYGAILVPDVLERTPPYIEAVLPDSPAARAGLKPDDLVIYVGKQLTPSCKAIGEELARTGPGEPLSLMVMRGADALEFVLGAPDEERRGAATQP